MTYNPRTFAHVDNNPENFLMSTIQTPDIPASGNRMYIKPDGFLYILDSAGVEIQVGSELHTYGELSFTDGSGTAFNVPLTTDHLINFFNESGTSANIHLSDGGDIPFFLADGQADDIILSEANVRGILNKDADYTIETDDMIVSGDATADPFTFTLPLAADAIGQIIKLKKTDATANVITIAASGTDVIDGSATLPITAQYQTYVLQSTGTTWHII